MPWKQTIGRDGSVGDKTRKRESAVHHMRGVASLPTDPSEAVGALQFPDSVFLVSEHRPDLEVSKSQFLG